MKENRQLFIAGNWKMNTSVTEGVKLAEGLKEKYGNIKGVRLAVAVPFTHISDVGKVIKGTSIELAAQNMNENEKGAFTGEISALMLKDLGVKLVIIGHSERRHIYGESNETIALKVRAVLNAGFECILCIGETREEREEALGLTGETIMFKKLISSGINQFYTPISAPNTYFFIVTCSSLLFWFSLIL